MQDFADDLLVLIQKPSTRMDVVPLYAVAILYEAFARPAASHTRWSIVNKAIIARWSFSGLEYIKNRAWRDAERMAKEEVEKQQTGAA